MKDKQHPAGQCVSAVQGVHGHIDHLDAMVGVHFQTGQLDLERLAQRLLDDAGQGFAQTLPGHGMDVEVELASGRLQVAAGSATDVQDVAFGVDQHGGRGVVLLDQLVGQLTEVFRELHGGWVGQ